MIELKRVYEPWDQRDGKRILVDRLWPRGVTKEKAHLDVWLKAIAPSTELRKWFGHDPDKWEEFQQRYRAELAAHGTAVSTILDASNEGTVTLVYAAKDEEHNEAVVLKDYLEGLSQGPASER